MRKSSSAVAKVNIDLLNAINIDDHQRVLCVLRIRAAGSVVSKLDSDTNLLECGPSKEKPGPYLSLC